MNSRGTTEGGLVGIHQEKQADTGAAAIPGGLIEGWTGAEIQAACEEAASLGSRWWKREVYHSAGGEREGDDSSNAARVGGSVPVGQLSGVLPDSSGRSPDAPTGNHSIRGEFDHGDDDDGEKHLERLRDS